MKYSEFEAIAKENGWEFDIDKDSKGWIVVSKNGFETAISKSIQNYLDLYTTKEGVIDLHREKEFIEACYELAETSPEEREDEKYYTVELPFLNVEDRKLSLRMSFATPYWSYELYSRFTEKEIKEIDPRLWEFAVEVKDGQGE